MRQKELKITSQSHEDILTSKWKTNRNDKYKGNIPIETRDSFPQALLNQSKYKNSCILSTMDQSDRTITICKEVK